MAIEANKYYPKQMNGPVISAFGDGINHEFLNAEEIERYLYDLTIDTAEETELENIGRLIGYVRPLVPEGFNNENLLIFGSLPIETDENSGFAQAGYSVGGQFSTIVSSQTDYMSLGLYRKMLKGMAIMKRYGITLQSVDQIAHTISDDYTLSFTENNDILITFNTSIGFRNLWILSKLFARIATEPQVLIASGKGE